MSTTLNKLEYLDETKKEIKNALNTNFNSGITDEDTFRSYVGKINDIYTNWDKVTGTGTEITLNNTKKGKMALTPKGNTEQTTYTGKNLLPNKVTSQTYKGLTFTHNEDGSLTINGTSTSGGQINICSVGEMPLSAGTYIMSSTTTIPSLVWLTLRDSSGDIKSITNSSETQVTLETDNTNTYVYIYFNSGVTLNNFTIYPMIRLSSVTDGTYEPYVGGTPSPSPDYPQDVRVVTGNNSVKVVGKNLFDNSTIVKGAAYSYGSIGTIPVYQPTNTRASISPTNAIRVKPNTKYTFGMNSTTWRYAIAKMEMDKKGLGDSGWQSSSTYTITTPANCYYIGFNFSKISNDSITDAEFNDFLNSNLIMVEGESIPTYEPYQSQTYPINLGTIELCKIPNTNYQDIIFHAINGDSFYDTLDNATKQTLTYGKWYKHSEIGKYTINSNAISTINTTQTNTTRVRTSSNIINPSADILGYCNYFTLVDNWSSDVVGLYYSTSNKDIWFRANKSLVGETLDSVKNWVSSNTINLYYPISTPTNTEITDTTLISQLNAIENSVSYDTQTNISSEYVESNAQMIISASALEKGGI